MKKRSQLVESRGYDYFELGPNDIAPGAIETKFSIIVLCTSGSCDIEINMTNVHLEKGTRMVLSHVLFQRGFKASPDFKSRALLVTNQFALDMLVGIPTEALSLIGETPLLNVTNDDEWQILNRLMDVVSIYSGQSSTVGTREIIGSCYRMIINVMIEFERDLARTRGSRPSYTMADIYFKKFIDMLEDNIKTEHEVAFYAQQLNITPKYLSEITKQKTNHKAKEVISHLLVTKLKREMLISGKSMKVIAYDYCFADQSSLGKFFRKMTGLSPSEFKKLRSSNDFDL